MGEAELSPKGISGALFSNRCIEIICCHWNVKTFTHASEIDKCIKNAFFCVLVLPSFGMFRDDKWVVLNTSSLSN